MYPVPTTTVQYFTVQHSVNTQMCFLSQKWARAFRDQEYHAAVDTNNGVEALNKALKYSYLPKRKSTTLSAVATLLVEDFLPECRKSYLFNNYKQSSAYRSYKDFVPEYLWDRPRNVILHCLDRRATSMKFKEGDIKEVDCQTGEFKVINSKTTKEHIVNLGHSSSDSMPNCSCLDWKKFHLPYKLQPGWTWNMLPPNYLESAYLSLDNKALHDYYHSQSLPASTPIEDADPPGGDRLTNNGTEDIPKRKVQSYLKS